MRHIKKRLFFIPVKITEDAVELVAQKLPGSYGPVFTDYSGEIKKNKGGQQNSLYKC